MQFQGGWNGPLVVVHSGPLDAAALLEVCGDLRIRAAIIPGDVNGHVKRNYGAGVAREMGARWVTFPNDYQHIRAGCLPLLELALQEQDGESHVGLRIGNVLGCNDRFFSRRFGPLSSDDALMKHWAFLSAVAEAGLICRTDVFLRLGGWRFPERKGRPILGGDGMLLTARMLSAGFHVAQEPLYVVEGGHHNPRYNAKDANRQRSSYVYAFSLATRHPGIPRAIAYRFVVGRLARAGQFALRGQILDARTTAKECHARLVGVLDLPVPAGARPGLGDYWRSLSSDAPLEPPLPKRFVD